MIATVAVIVALLAPRITWRLNQRSQEEKDKRNTKLWIFGELMQHRHTSQSREAIRAFNLIDVAFHDDEVIRRLWREYHSMISNPSFFSSTTGHELVKQKRVQLLENMAKNLKYNIDAFDIERTYTPNWLAEEEEFLDRDRRLRLFHARKTENALRSSNDTVVVPHDSTAATAETDTASASNVSPMERD